MARYDRLGLETYGGVEHVHVRPATAAMARLFLPCLLLAAGFTVALLALTSGVAHADSRHGAAQGSSATASSSSGDRRPADRGHHGAGDAIRAVVDHTAGRPELRDTGVPAQAEHGVAAVRETVRETAERVTNTASDSRDRVERAAQNVEKRAVATVRRAETRVGDTPVVGQLAPQLRLADRLQLLVRVARHTAGSDPVPELDGVPVPLARVLGVVSASTTTKMVASQAPVAAHGAPALDAAGVAALAAPAGVPAATFGTPDPVTDLAVPASPVAPVPSGTAPGAASATAGGVMALTEAQARVDLGLGVAVAPAARANPPVGPALRPGVAPD